MKKTFFLSWKSTGLSLSWKIWNFETVPAGERSRNMGVLGKQFWKRHLQKTEMVWKIELTFGQMSGKVPGSRILVWKIRVFLTQRGKRHFLKNAGKVQEKTQIV